MKTRSNQALNTSVKIAMLSALAFVLMRLEFSIPIFPSFLKFEFSEVPVIIGSFALGPWCGVLIELVKNLLHLTVTSNAGVGEIANFIIGSSYVLVAGYFYKKFKTKKGAIVSTILGSLTAIIFAGLVNYFILLPLYAAVMGLSTEMIVGMSSQVVPYITDKFTLILFGFIPFNILKNLVMSVVILLIYKPLSPLLHRTYIK